MPISRMRERTVASMMLVVVPRRPQASVTAATSTSVAVSASAIFAAVTDNSVSICAL